MKVEINVDNPKNTPTVKENMTEPMYSEDVTEWTEINNERDASRLLSESFPGIEGKLNRAANKLAALLGEINSVFPDAEYYTSGGDGFALILGRTHDKGIGIDSNACQERSAWMNAKLTVGGGDW